MERDCLRYISRFSLMLLALFLVRSVSAQRVFEPFEVGSAADADSGIYLEYNESNLTESSLAGLANSDVVGGRQEGFDATEPWTLVGASSSMWHAVPNGLSLPGNQDGISGSGFYRRSSGVGRNLTRRHNLTLSGTEPALISAMVKMDTTQPDVGKEAAVGFNNGSKSGNMAGAFVGFQGNGSTWDLIVTYSNGTEKVERVLLESVGVGETDSYHVVLELDSTADTLAAWINPAPSSTRPTPHLLFPDYEGDITEVDRLFAYVDGLHSSGSSGEGFYFDQLALAQDWATLLPISEELVRYVAPAALGSGDGSTPANAAAFEDMTFWNDMADISQGSDVRIQLLDGVYDDGGLLVYGLGSDEFHITIEGESPDGVVLSANTATMLSLRGLRNATIRWLNFTGPIQGYALQITSSGTRSCYNILIEECTWEDLPDLYYGCFGTTYDVSHVTVRHCIFKDAGSDSHHHFVYNAYGPSNLTFEFNRFENSAGDYLRFRDECDFGVVRYNEFISTQSSSNYPFVAMPLFNDVDPGDESFATNYQIYGNTFSYYRQSGSSTTPRSPNAVVFLHKGYEPAAWTYFLTPAQATLLQSGTDAERAGVLLDNTGIDVTKVSFFDNVIENATGIVRYRVEEAYGSSGRGWTGEIEISDLLADDLPLGDAAYLAWAEGAFATSTPIDSMKKHADPDSDGLENWVEAALGTSPTVADSSLSFPVNTVTQGGYSFLEYTLPWDTDDAFTNAWFELSADLTTWTQIDHAALRILEDSIVVRDFLALQDPNTQRFMRVVFERPKVYAYEPFNSRDDALPSAGVYEANLAFNAAPNDDIHEGAIIGLTAGEPYDINTGTFYRPQLFGLHTPQRSGAGGSAMALRTNSTTTRVLSREIDADIEGNRVWMSMLLSMDNSTASATVENQAFAGFYDGSDGALAGFVSDMNSSGAVWQLCVRYRDVNDSVQVEVVAPDVGTSDTGVHFVVLCLDEVEGTIKVWLNPTQSFHPTEPTATFTDYGSGVDIAEIYSMAFAIGYDDGASSSSVYGFRFDELALGATWSDVTTLPVSE